MRDRKYAMQNWECFNPLCKAPLRKWSKKDQEYKVIAGINHHHILQLASPEVKDGMIVIPLADGSGRQFWAGLNALWNIIIYCSVVCHSDHAHSKSKKRPRL